MKVVVKVNVFKSSGCEKPAEVSDIGTKRRACVKSGADEVLEAEEDEEEDDEVDNWSEAAS